MTCEHCKKKDSCLERITNEIYEEKTMTNGDRIRQMSNEELAEMLGDNNGCPPDMPLSKCVTVTCNECWLDWLEQEAEEEKK